MIFILYFTFNSIAVKNLSNSCVLSMWKLFNGFCIITSMAFHHGDGKFIHTTIYIECKCQKSYNKIIFSRFYPFHYAPYVSDIKDFQDHPLSFNMGKAFLPFEQLLAVLPAASKTLLPELFQSLMIMEHSPIIDYYPPEFETDLNGKRQDWEAVVLIPFIDEVCHLLKTQFNLLNEGF